MCACSPPQHTHECTHATRYMIPTHTHTHTPKAASHTNLQPCCPPPVCLALNILDRRVEVRRLLGLHTLPSSPTTRLTSRQRAQKAPMAKCTKPRTLLSSCSTQSGANTAVLTGFSAKGWHECQDTAECSPRGFVTRGEHGGPRQAPEVLGGGTGQRKASGKTSSPDPPPAEEFPTLQAPPSLQPLGNQKDPVDNLGRRQAGSANFPYTPSPLAGGHQVPPVHLPGQRRPPLQI